MTSNNFFKLLVFNYIYYMGTRLWFWLCHLGNVADLLLTLYALGRGVEEANPFMAWTISISPWFFVFTKIFIFAVAIDFIQKKRPHLLKWVAALFGGVFLWHLLFVFVI
mgnify:FL=1